MRTMTRVFAILPLLLPALLSHACRAVEPAPKATPKNIQLPGVMINFQEHCVDIAGTVCLDHGLLELIACTQGTKEHESLVAIKAKSMHIHGALLLLGANTGEPVDVFLLVKDKGGRVVEHAISQFIEPSDHATEMQRDAGAKTTLSNTFLFAGSHLHVDSSGKKQYLSDLSGNVISIATFGDELLRLPGGYGHQNSMLMWQVDPAELPAVGTEVVLRLRRSPTSSGFNSCNISTDQLRCEYRDNPLGIDVPAPRLSWTLTSSVRGEGQTAYRILVSQSGLNLLKGHGDIWDSGKVYSDQSVNIPYAGKPLASGQCYLWKVKVWDKEGNSSKVWNETASWEMGLLDSGDWQASWINDGKPLPEKDADFYKDDAAPLFRKPFKVSKPVKRARLYISALGYVHATLNGQDTSDHHLAPIWTLPNKRVFYSVHDVGDKLASGDNCLGVTLGNGWYNPVPLRMWGRVNLRERLPVGRPQFIAQLLIEYADGTRETVKSDASWKVAPGPIIRNSIYLGEKYDARKIVKDWDKPGLDDSAWASAKTAPPPEGPLQARPVPPIKITETVKPIKITEPSDGVYIVDMGENFGGWAGFTFNVPEGTEITMRYGELLYDDGTLNPMTSVCGQIKRKKPTADGSPPTAWQADTYIARGGGPETYTPRFTFHAFRYIEVKGLPKPPALRDITGHRMHSAVPTAGAFSCSNGLFNRIQAMCRRTFLSNIFGVQSDCPHRERFGYGGDLVTTSDAFIFNFDMADFYAKATRDWHDSALPNGMLTDTAPSVGIQYCYVGWAMAHPHLQEQLYRYYGDMRIIEEQYATSKRWLDLVRQQNKDHIIRRGLHDHEALEKEKSAPMVTPLYCESARMLSRLAGILGKKDEAAEYARLAEDIRKAYIQEFLAKGTGVVASGIQAAQAFALFLDMLPAVQRPAALAHLIKDITEKHKGHLTTGIFGTRYMLDVLSREGRIDVVNRMVNLRDFPGWGHMLAEGATTLWEHWKFSDNTFSHNHPMFGSVSQWFFNWLGGIEPAPDAVGFDKFSFQPQFVEDMDWVCCSYRSIRGPITCNWKRQGKAVKLTLQVPVNSAATLILPAGGSVTENGKPAADAEGVEKMSEQNDALTFKLASGNYHFLFTPKAAK